MFEHLEMPSGVRTRDARDALAFGGVRPVRAVGCVTEILSSLGRGPGKESAEPLVHPAATDSLYGLCVGYLADIVLVLDHGIAISDPRGFSGASPRRGPE